MQQRYLAAYHLVSAIFPETAVNLMALVDIFDWNVHESATSSIYDSQIGMLEHTKGTLQQQDSSSKSPGSNLRIVNEKHIEDNEENIGVVEPQCGHSASRWCHKVFLFTGTAKTKVLEYN